MTTLQSTYVIPPLLDDGWLRFNNRRFLLCFGGGGGGGGGSGGLGWGITTALLLLLWLFLLLRFFALTTAFYSYIRTRISYDIAYVASLKAELLRLTEAE